MLKYVPLYGSILLTIIILWIIGSTIVGNRRKIGQAAAGTYIRSSCCGATTTPLGWTQDGWTSRCDECGLFQYLGDDFDNRPPGFPTEVTSRRSPHSLGAAIEPESAGASGLRLDDVWTSEDLDKAIAHGRRIDADENATVLPIEPREWGEGKIFCVHQYYVKDDGTTKCPSCRREREIDDSEPLAVPPQPNIGGVDHPDYQGPHYEVEHDRFVPYDMLHDPEPGQAIHKVGPVAFAGPLPAEGDRGNDETATRREDGDDS
jgi:hypothetical protein